MAITKSTAPKAGKMYLQCRWKACFDGRWKILAIALKAEMILIPTTLLLSLLSYTIHQENSVNVTRWMLPDET